MTGDHQTINTETPFAAFLRQRGKPRPYKDLLASQGVSATTIRRWEAGQTTPAAWLQKLIAASLKCDRDLLWPA